MRRRALLLAACLLAPAVRADEATGLQSARAARHELLKGNAGGALELLEKARIELPGSDVIACTRGDALLALGRGSEAQSEYERALSGPLAHHAHFNRGVARDAQAEQALEAAGVPADVAALPEGPQPGMLQAVRAARPQLEGARQDFLDALDLDDEPQARESVGALNRRLDALKAIEDELSLREQADQKQDEGQDKQDQQQPRDKQDGQPKDDSQQQQDQQQDGQQGEPKDQQQDGQQQQQQAEPQDQDKAQEPSPQDAGQDQQGQQAEGQPPAQVARELSEEEAQRLLDTLARLEAAARARQKARETAAHKKAEKDW